VRAFNAKKSQARGDAHEVGAQRDELAARLQRLREVVPRGADPL